MKQHPASVIRIERSVLQELWRVVERGTTKTGLKAGEAIVLAAFNSLDNALISRRKVDGVSKCNP